MRGVEPMAYHLIQLNQIRDVHLGRIHFQSRVETLKVEERSHNKIYQDLFSLVFLILQGV